MRVDVILSFRAGTTGALQRKEEQLNSKLSQHPNHLIPQVHSQLPHSQRQLPALDPSQLLTVLKTVKELLIRAVPHRLENNLKKIKVVLQRRVPRN